MYKKAIGLLILCNMIFLAGFLCVRGTDHAKGMSRPASMISLTLGEVGEKAETCGEESMALGIADRAVSGQRVVDFTVLEQETADMLEASELDILLRIVESEAGSEDADGRLLVANVILNRVNDEHFPSTVSEVVFQQQNGVAQFSPVASGRIHQVEVSEETREAVERALDGEDISQGALYFAARKYADSTKMKWFDEHLVYLFQHGGHEFFK
ncbi:MAG: cell wall hydrolase [Blautia sp.]|nr:cell wall hydrolase [Blautia sp.]